MPDLNPTLRLLNYNSDEPPEELPQDVLSLVDNAEAIDGHYRQARPYAQVFGTLSGAPRWLLPNQTPASAFWIYATDTAVYVTDGTTHWDITLGTPTNTTTTPAPFSGGIINQLPVLNSIVDGPSYWDQNTANNLVALPGWPAGDLCNVMRPFREFLIAMNNFETGARIPDLVKWSDAAAQGAVPANWTPSVSSQAGSVTVSFNAGGLVEGRQLIDRFYMYKTSSCYLLQLIGGAFVFTQRPVFSTVGALARDCVEEYRGKHIVLTDGDLIQHDGVTVESLVSRQQRKRIFDELDGTNFDNSYLYLNRSKGELGICRPRAGETYPSEVLTLSLNDLKWGDRSIPAQTAHIAEGLVDSAGASAETTWQQKTTTWATDPTRWNSATFLRTADFMLMADYGGSKVQQIDEGADFDGATIDATLERTGLDLGDPDTRKYAGRVYPSITGSPGATIQVELGAHDLPDGAVTWAAAQDFVIGTTRFLNFDVQGYYLAYRFKASGQLNWCVTKLKLEANVQGPF